ncbi:uncharacterized protein EAF01_000850 [Botrytis porri]|uniref:Copper homeostasis protein cutC homolog n=1 Tax=Botrytis porri TaxID=87229 RepID=A0A4Z1KFR3_9HELO|nr:uncharacterized protein EAF01_000850 [Botrytis porri]KAF7914444.1 hypothetical protein EAF01_000850 [Botrytis porri]TGO84983.1 hypothetical protein BPOR_0444g00100 [Botrytis porri]
MSDPEFHPATPLSPSQTNPTPHPKEISPRTQMPNTISRMSPNLEIATFTPSSALRALKSGAQRIELCAHKDRDGLTPDMDDFSSVYSALHFQNEKTDDEKIYEKEEKEKGEINIMIRPVDNSCLGIGSNDNFRVGDEVFEEMKGEIRRFRELGGRGFVFGILMDEGEAGKGLVVDRERCAELIGIAREGKDGENVRCTFHRAFDRIESVRMEEELEVLINLNFTSLLTSGGAPTSVQGVVQLQKLVQQAAGRIDIIVGGGVRSRNLEELMEETGARWFHSSAVIGDGEDVDGEEVEKMRYILEGTRVD